MYGVELYAAVRLAVVDEGLSHHEAGRRFGIDRRTVKKMLSYSAPPGYRRTKPVKREYIQVLRLHEDFPERQVAAAVRDAVKRRLIGFDAVKHLLLARIERRPVHLDLSRYPHLPRPFVAATRSADYATLLAADHG